MGFFNFRYFVVFLLWSNFAIAQKDIVFPARFQDYPWCTNLDSLEQAVDAQKGDPTRYLHGLITLELNRIMYSEKFGQDLETIKSLAESEHSEIGLAMYHFLFHYHNPYRNLDESVKICLKAIEFFEANHDSLGMVNCYIQMVVLNQSLQNNLNGDRETLARYYNKVVQLGETTTDPAVKLLAMSMLVMKSHPTAKNNEIEKAQAAYQEAEKIMEKHPELSRFRSNFYTNMGTRYYSENDYIALLAYHQKAYESSKKKGCKKRFTDTYNLGNAYYYNKKLESAIKYYNEAIHLFQTCNNGNLELAAKVYKMLAITKYKQKKYEEAWQLSEIGDSLSAASVENLRSSRLLEFQTKYETNKKEAENQRLQLEQINARQKIRFYGIGILTLLLASIVLAWLYQKIKSKNIELSRLNQLIQNQNQRLAEANLQMEQFTYALSHDAISYINHIINLTTLAKDTDSISFAQGILQKINRNASNLKKMAQNLIRFNKMKQAQLHKDTIALDQLIAEVLEDAEDELLSGKTQIQLGKLPVVMANREMLKQVFHNLIGNATKFRKQDLPLKVSIFAQNVGNGFAEISVVDNGIGIPEEKQPYIFQEFVKGDRQKEGSGLGLFISKRIVEDLGGTIYVESTEGVGSQFIFTLPYASEAEE